MNLSGPGQLQSYFNAAMKKYEHDQARIRSAILTISPGACIPDVEMEQLDRVTRSRKITNQEIRDLKIQDDHKCQLHGDCVGGRDGT